MQGLRVGLRGTHLNSRAASRRQGSAWRRDYRAAYLRSPVSPAAQASGNVPPSPSTSTTPAPRDYSIGLFDAMMFNGPAPELVNGRLAMVGFLSGAWQEAHGGLTLAQQAAQMPLSELVLLAMWVYASLVPILKGAKMEAFGWFAPRAEITNGRAAMLGIAVLLFLEHKAGVPFF